MGRDGTKSRFVGIGYLTPLHPPLPSLSSILLSSDGDTGWTNDDEWETRLERSSGRQSSGRHELCLYL